MEGVFAIECLVLERVDDIEASIGAGFLTPICGGMNLMPGLPKIPGGENIDVDENDKIVGLF